MRLFDDKFDVKSLQAKYIKTKIKTAYKNDFYNVNIDSVKILNNNDLINQFNYVSYEELLELDKTSELSNVRVQNLNKIFNISLN